jgi:hypothetical protein
VKHSLNTKKRNRLIESLRLSNEDLKRSLEGSEVPAEDDSQRVQDLIHRFSIERCDAIRQRLSSFHRALGSELRCTCSPPHQAAIDLDWNMYELDRAKTFRVAISYETNLQAQEGVGSWRTLRITSETPIIEADQVTELLTPSPLPARVPSPFSSFRSKITRFSRSPSQTSPTTPPSAAVAPSAPSTISE